MTRIVLLGDIAEKITKGTTPTTYGAAFTDEGINFVKVESITEYGGFLTDKFVHIDESTHRNLLKRSIIEEGDILLTMAGAIGRVAQVPRRILPANTNQAVSIIRINAEDVDRRYVRYFLESPDARGQFLSGITQSAQPNLSLGNISKIKVPLPNLEIQKKIADILGTIDEKIELNRKMNETLEQMGQALFRHYFIDNPEAEKWDKRELGEFFPIKTGKKDANFGTEDGEFPFFTCAQTISKAPNYSFDAHAILLAGNGDFNLKLYRGKFEAYQRTYVLVPSDERLVGLLYFLMKMKLSEITGGSRGSVIKFITKGMIENYKCALPGDAKLIEMAEVFNQLTINIEENVIQTQTLTALRDTLLPRLISGKVNL